MSGINERIASRRRGSPSSELDPASENGHTRNGEGVPAPPQGATPVAEPEPSPQAEPSQAEAPADPGFLTRGRMRRRARYLRQVREIQLRDIGGFVLELHRFGHERPDLVQAKVAWAAQTDAELRALERALREDHPMRELREPGIGGACETCGAVYGSQDRFCATCGEPLTGDGPADDDRLDPDHPGGVR
jgi:hypothetical protein